MNRAQGLAALFGLVALAMAWQISGHFRPWTSFQQQWVAAFGGAWIVFAALMHRGIWHWPRPALAMLALALVPLIQTGVGQVIFHSDGLLSVLYLVAFAACIAAAAALVEQEPERWPDNLMVALLMGAMLSAALAFVQWLSVDLPFVSVEPLPPGERVYANLAQANHLATLQCLGITAGLYFFERRRLGPLAVLLLCAFMAWALVLTQSRVGWVFGGLLALGWMFGRRHLRLRGAPLLAGLLLFAVATALFSRLNEALLLAAPFADLDQRLSTGTRPANWLALGEAALRKPWFGWGWTQVSLAQLSIAYERPITHETVHNAHNVLLDLAVWMGIPGTVILAALVLWWGASQLRACKQMRHGAFLLMIAVIGVHALTEYPLEYTYFLLPLGLLVGTVQAWSRPAPRPTTGRAPVLVAWLAGMGLLFWIAAEYLEVEDSARTVRLLMAGVGVDKVPYAPPPDVTLLDAPREYHRYWITPATRGMSVEQLDWMRRVAQRNHYPPALLRYALAAGMNGRVDDAARMLRAICHINPPARCTEARESWRIATERYPELATIALP